MKISVINRKLDSQPMVGTDNLPGVSGSGGLPGQLTVGLRKRRLEPSKEWKSVIFPPDSYTLDSQPMVGTTYLERPAPAVYLDSWLMKGASYPQPHVNWEVLSSKPSLNGEWRLSGDCETGGYRCKR